MPIKTMKSVASEANASPSNPSNGLIMMAVLQKSFVALRAAINCCFAVSAYKVSRFTVFISDGWASVLVPV